jgi:hypothetical protein
MQFLASLQFDSDIVVHGHSFPQGRPA